MNLTRDLHFLHSSGNKSVVYKPPLVSYISISELRHMLIFSLEHCCQLVLHVKLSNYHAHAQLPLGDSSLQRLARMKQQKLDDLDGLGLQGCQDTHFSIIKCHIPD